MVVSKTNVFHLPLEAALEAMYVSILQHAHALGLIVTLRLQLHELIQEFVQMAAATLWDVQHAVIKFVLLLLQVLVYVAVTHIFRLNLTVINIMLELV